MTRPATDTMRSLPESHGTIAVPRGGGFWRRLLAFIGPGWLVAVGYMDPGNWATDIAGGSAFGYTLLSVILLSNLMAIVLQALAARLRHAERIIVAGRRWRCGSCARSRLSPVISQRCSARRSR